MRDVSDEGMMKEKNIVGYLHRCRGPEISKRTRDWGVALKRCDPIGKEIASVGVKGGDEKSASLKKEMSLIKEKMTFMEIHWIPKANWNATPKG
ncbi:hypothetical protein L2E82_51127 [Cichorium intybus]|nr:hypothetical protein L2E82_51127 [Cichorium intybus]